MVNKFQIMEFFRRLKYAVGIVFLASINFACNPAEGNRKLTKPNVLFIAIDDLRTQLGCYGESSVISPNINRLAEGGLVFNRAYCQMASCGPSRASLLSGRRPDVTRIFDNRPVLREMLPDIVTLPQQFKNYGYHTQSFGKVFHGIFKGEIREDSLSWTLPAWRPMAIQYFTDNGIEVIKERHSEYIKKAGNVWDAMAERRLKGLPWEAPDLPDNEFVDGKIAEKAVETLNQVKGKPFFLAVGFTKPHLPFVAPKKYYDLYKGKDIKPITGEQLPTRAPWQSHNSDSKELRGYSSMPQHGALSLEEAYELTLAYNACVSFVDAQIGKVLDELQRLNLHKNTMVVLWGDHGYHLGHLGLWCKNTNFETAVRVPLIISYPHSSFSGKRTNVIVELLDLMPTLCEFAGLPIPDGTQGKSLLPLLNDPRKEWDKTAVSQHTRILPGEKPLLYMGYSLRTDQFRYTEWIPDDTAKETEFELYDLRNSKVETENVALIEKYNSVKKQHAKMLHEILGNE
jgi:arylsulfatase A-like enzyme